MMVTMVNDMIEILIANCRHIKNNSLKTVN